MLLSLQLLPWKQSLKNQVSKIYLVFFADLLKYKLNIKQSKAIKASRVLFVYPKLQPAAHEDTFPRVDIVNLVTIATRSSVFKKK